MGLFIKDNNISKNSKEAVQVLMDCHFPGSHPYNPDYTTSSRSSPKISHSFIKSASFLSYITIEKVKASINSFGWNKSPGPDG